MRTRMTFAVPAIMTMIPALVMTTPMLTGSLDPHFGDGGAVVAQAAPGEASDYQNGLALEPDGGIVVGGESDFGEAVGFQWRVARYTRNGLADRTFGAGGTALTNMSTVGGFDERLTSLAVQHDGKIVAGGWILTGPGTQDSALARYNVDGSLDASFGDGGIVVTDVASEPDHDFINQVLIDSVGRIVVAGGCRRMFVARYQFDGSLHRIVPSAAAASPS